MINKRGMLAREWVIVLLVFSLFAGIGALIVSDMADETNGYNRPSIVDSNFDSSYNKLSTLSPQIDAVGNSTSSKAGLSFTGTSDGGFLGSTFAVISLVFSSPAMVKNVFVDLGTTLGLPPVISNLLFVALLGIIVSLLIFIIVSSLTKSRI